MKIDQQNLAAANSGAARASDVGAASLSKSGARTFAGEGGGDSVEISGVSRVIQSYSSQRAAKVQQLKAQVGSGQYAADPALVSKALVNESLAGRAAQ
jgi:anti-sigma28 factor (negative regulator of flagellin synthesis)